MGKVENPDYKTQDRFFDTLKGCQVVIFLSSGKRLKGIFFDYDSYGVALIVQKPGGVEQYYIFKRSITMVQPMERVKLPPVERWLKLKEGKE